MVQSQVQEFLALQQYFWQRWVIALPSKPSWQGSDPRLTSELMLSALGFTRMMVSRISLWWERVLWPEGGRDAGFCIEESEYRLKGRGIVWGRREKNILSGNGAEGKVEPSYP